MTHSTLPAEDLGMTDLAMSRQTGNSSFPSYLCRDSQNLNFTNYVTTLKIFLDIANVAKHHDDSESVASDVGCDAHRIL